MEKWTVGLLKEVVTQNGNFTQSSSKQNPSCNWKVICNSENSKKIICDNFVSNLRKSVWLWSL